MDFKNEAPYSSSRREFCRLDDREIDQLFYLSPIHEALCDFIRRVGNQPWHLMEEGFLKADCNERAEWLFASRMLALHGASIPQIDYLLDSVPPSLQLDELKDRRNELIMRLVGTEAGKHWTKCIKMENGWKYVARFVYGDKRGLSNDDVDSFFMSLDQIAIMHDMIMGRGKKYGFDFRPTTEENVKAILQYCFKHDKNLAQKILKRLHHYIDKATTPKRASRPVRALMEAGALTERLPWEVYEKEFGSDNNNKSSYNEYTNIDKPNPFDDSLYTEMVKEFKELI